MTDFLEIESSLRIRIKKLQDLKSIADGMLKTANMLNSIRREKENPAKIVVGIGDDHFYLDTYRNTYIGLDDIETKRQKVLDAIDDYLSDILAAQNKNFNENKETLV